MWIRYVRLLHDRPMLTKSITSGILSFGADFMCQTNEQYAKHQGPIKLEADLQKEPLFMDILNKIKYDWFRMGRFTLLGTVFVGPILHSWSEFSLLNTVPY